MIGMFAASELFGLVGKNYLVDSTSAVRGVSLTIQANDPNFDGTLGLIAKIFTKDTPTDGEYDTTDNTNNATTQFSVKWTPEIDPPSITVNNGIDDAKVKEDGSVDVRVQANLDPNAVRVVVERTPGEPWLGIRPSTLY